MMRKHASIVGITGSGKTVLAAKLFTEQPTLCIFINTNAEIFPERNAQVIIHDVDGFKKAWNDYHARKICYSPTASEDIKTEDVEELVSLLFQVGKAINKESREPTIWCTLFIDEIQEYSSKFKKSTKIDGIFKRGRRFGIVGVAISQRPAEISHTILVNCHEHIIFQVSQYETEYFSTYHIPVFDVPEADAWVKRSFHYLIWNGVEFKYCEPVAM
jgi:hypothetical protein